MRRNATTFATTFSAEQRTEAVALAARIGAAATARQLGIKDATVRQWTKRATDGASAAIERVSAELVPATTGNLWRDNQPRLLDALTTSIGGAMTMMAKAIKDNDARRAQSYAVTVGILIDKARLQVGMPTRRTESNSTAMVMTVNRDGPEVLAEIEALRAQLGIDGRRA